MFLKPQEVIQFLSARLFLLARSRLADFGCGGGYFTALLAEKIGPGGLVFAVDIQASALAETKELSELFAFQNIRFYQADIKKTPFEDQFFEAIFLSQVLFQASAREAILDEAVRVLKNKGLLIIIEPEQPLLFLPQQSAAGLVMPKEQLLELCRPRGLNVLAQRNFEDNYYLTVTEKNG